MFRLYSLLFSFGVLFMAPWYAWRHRKSRFLRKAWRERLGYLPEEFQQSERGAIWVHAVSVGETLAVSTLIKELQRRHPDRKIFISHVTPAGREAGEKRMPGLAGRFYLPLDLKGSTQRALRRLRPELLLIAETELWPNLLRWSHEAGARVVLVNARLSSRSVPGYRRFRFFMRRVLSYVDWIMAQTPADVERFLEIGAPAERVLALGNLKFDVHPPENTNLAESWRNSFATAGRGPVMIAASTMLGEEELVLAAWKGIRRQNPQAIIILAPRHPSRFGEVAALLRASGSRFVRRSDISGPGASLGSPFDSVEVVLLDSIGELAGLFCLADLVFMGGSLVPTGGHNLLEPARFAKPVIFGPHMGNFADLARLFLDCGAASQVKNSSELGTRAIDLLAHEHQRRAMGEAAREVVKQESGATQRILERLSGILGEPDVGRVAGRKN
ncbi:MAG: 3-deoxy-D-manno-octulosonic acid transferase [Terriglobia bacterium]